MVAKTMFAILPLQSFYGFMDFVRDNPCELVPEETPTHRPIVIFKICHQLLGALPPDPHREGHCWGTSSNINHSNINNQQCYCG